MCAYFWKKLCIERESEIYIERERERFDEFDIYDVNYIILLC
jgi:hypothetical protein